jgi:formate-dependent nitrite reductase cytochrome c552 subunit
MRTRERSSDHRLSQSRHGKFLLALVAVIICFAAFSTPAQDNQNCFACHSDAELTGSRGGEEMSVYVAEERYSASVHSDMACVECHQDIDPKRRRHSTRQDLELVDCSGCHRPEAARHERSLHGVAATRGDPMAPVCADCHGKHDILPASDHDSPTAVMNVPLL